jgi:sulfate adenylyltransferase subunit 2
MENVPLPDLYLAKERECFERNGVVLAHSDYINMRPEEKEAVAKRMIRFRTIGDMTCTGAVYSEADTLEKVVAEVASTRVTERGGRSDDKRSETAMEDRKKHGYF